MPQENETEQTEPTGTETVETPTPVLSPPVSNEPNIIFVGTRSRNGEEERLTEAPTNLINGPDEFSDLPSSEEQLAGFYHERAAEICRAFPGLYKTLVKKGE